MEIFYQQTTKVRSRLFIKNNEFDTLASNDNGFHYVTFQSKLL
jgi:hypothetical protein